MRSKNYEEKLTTLSEFLRRPRTAREIMDMFGVGKVTAYARVRALKRRGVRLQKTERREGKSGPLSVAWQVLT
jgi:transposase